MCLVSDGHGDKRCYKSDLGAWLAIEVARWALNDFVAHTQLPDNCQQQEIEARMKQLFSAIVVEWQRGIAYDLGIEAAELTREQLHVYGCTLMGYLQTNNYWFAFQIGDGKLLVRQSVCRKTEKVGEPLWSQPVPWDDECISNITTSMCSSHTVERFRYHFSQGDKPSAVFAGSDGLDDTFGDGAGLERFYSHVLDSIVTDGLKTVVRQMPRVLKHYSEVGSHDDMSVAMVLNL